MVLRQRRAQAELAPPAASLPCRNLGAAILAAAGSPLAAALLLPRHGGREGSGRPVEPQSRADALDDDGLARAERRAESGAARRASLPSAVAHLGRPSSPPAAR